MTIISWLFQRATNTAQPQAFSFPPTGSWDGNDGSWSTFIVTVGSPPQTFRILPATNGDETWVPIPAGCAQTGDPTNCGDLRGVDTFRGGPSPGFEKNESSTWVENGTFNLPIGANLALSSSSTGDFGFDTIGLGNNSNSLSLAHQVVAGIATKTFWLGLFGLSPEPANLTTPVPSFMETLANQNLIPSLSFGYTAGAKYRGDKYLGSLTLGGYDDSRHQSNNVSFEFSTNGSRNLTVGLQSITATQTLAGDVQLLQSGIFSLIDSGVPEIWLPTAACDIFESAFGLIYDNSTDLYLVNDTIHSSLQQLNPAITFNIGPQAIGAPSIAFELPYAAFDLQASYPIYPNATKYFPIRRANETQYTLGRTFLQEAYITVDYTRSKFHVSQAAFPATSSQKLIAIYPSNVTTTGASQSGSSQPSTSPVSTSQAGTSQSSTSVKSGLGAGGIAGIVLGSIAIFVLLICALAFYCIRRKGRPRWLPAKGVSKNRQWISELPGKEHNEAANESLEMIKRPTSRVTEADGKSTPLWSEKTELESPSRGVAKELPGLLSHRQELTGSTPASDEKIELESPATGSAKALPALPSSRRPPELADSRAAKPVCELPGEGHFQTRAASS